MCYSFAADELWGVRYTFVFRNAKTIDETTTEEEVDKPVAAPTDASAPGDAPADVAVPGDAPADVAVPGDAPADVAAPGDAPIDVAAPADAPMDVAAPADAPSDSAPAADDVAVDEAALSVMESEGQSTHELLKTSDEESESDAVSSEGDPSLGTSESGDYHMGRTSPISSMGDYASSFMDDDPSGWVSAVRKFH